MRNLITTIALLALLGSPGAIAQTTGSARSPAEFASPTARSSAGPHPVIASAARELLNKSENIWYEAMCAERQRDVTGVIERTVATSEQT
jgi:hypothetical protein